MVSYKTKRVAKDLDSLAHSTAASSTNEETLSSSAASQGNYDNLSMLQQTQVSQPKTISLNIMGSLTK